MTIRPPQLYNIQTNIISGHLQTIPLVPQKLFSGDGPAAIIIKVILN